MPEAADIIVNAFKERGIKDTCLCETPLLKEMGLKKALEDAIAHNFKEVYVWAGTQVRRDNKILGYDEYAILHNLEMTGNPGIVSPVITSPDYVSIGENFTIEIQTNQ